MYGRYKLVSENTGQQVMPPWWPKITDKVKLQAMYQTLTKDMPPQETISMQLTANNSLIIYLDFYSRGRQHSKFSLKFDPKTSIGELSRADVYAERGQGAGTAFLRNAEELWRMLGTKSVEVSSEKVGSYFYLRIGFLPLNLDFIGRVERRLEIYSPQLPASAVEYATKLMKPVSGKTPDRKIAWALSDMPNMVKSLAGERQKLGQALFYDIQWRGSRDLHDDEANDRSKAYIGNRLGMGIVK